MKRFLWLAAALAAMVLVGCSNNAGGGGGTPQRVQTIMLPWRGGGNTIQRPMEFH